MRSDCSVSVLNKGLKLELHLLGTICVDVLNCILCAEYWIGKMGTTIGILTKSKMYRLDSQPSTSDEIRIITNDLQLYCS